MERNQAGFLYVTAFAYSPHALDSGDPVPDDEANITCQVSKDGGSYAALATNVATPVPSAGSNIYRFPIAASEVDAQQTHFAPTSATPGVQVVVDYDASNLGKNMSLLHLGGAGDSVPGGVDVWRMVGGLDGALTLKRMNEVPTPGEVTDTPVAPTTTAVQAANITNATGAFTGGPPRWIGFFSGVAKGEVRIIETYTLVGGQGRFEFPSHPLSNAPADGDDFLVV